MDQSIAWQLSLTLVAALAAGFVFVIANARQRRDYAPVVHRAYRFRARLFWAIVVLGVPATVFTLSRIPYPAFAGVPANVQVVDAIGYQWWWELSTDRVQAGQPVEFRLTSGDVNHGFGIYDENLRLVAQAQAMPGYVNRLVHTFDRPGRYRLLCLEFCGVVHHDMVAELEVTP